MGPVDDGTVADDGALTDGNGGTGRGFQKGQIENGGALSYDRRRLVSPEDGHWPDADALPDDDIAYQASGVVDEGGIMDDGRPARKGRDVVSRCVRRCRDIRACLPGPGLGGQPWQGGQRPEPET